MKTPEEKLAYWVDRQEILDCVCRYARGLDRHDDEILTSVFHPDAVDNHGKWIGTRDEFVRWANDTAHSVYAAHTHNITTHSCEIDGDTAHAESYVMWVLRYREGQMVKVGGGRYIDRLEKRDGDWRIVVRRAIMDWRFTADGASFDEPHGYEPGRWDRGDPSYERPLRMPAELLARVKA